MASLRSEDPYLKVGCVALDEDGRVLATGYNGLPPKINLTPSEWAHRDARLWFITHAEVNCLARCRRGEVRTLAVTTQPCSNCVNTISAHGVKRVIYGDPYSRDPKSLVLLKRYGIAYIQIPLQVVCEAIAAGLKLD